MKPILICLLVVMFFSCRNNNEEKVHPVYFDLATYFKKEALRLSKKNPSVNKMVLVDGKTERKNVIIKNWEKEFEIFIAADINKASWLGSFKKSSTLGYYAKGHFSYFVKLDSMITYTSKSDKIPVKKIEIVKDNNRINSIKIYIHNTNVLFTSQDTLSYFPDSLYHITKTQKIKLLSEKRYEIIGRF